LLALGRQFDAALAKLSSLQMDGADDTDATERIEAFLARMEPIERAIMVIAADGMAGVAVKARVAAHIVSNYWTCRLIAWTSMPWRSGFSSRRSAALPACRFPSVRRQHSPWLTKCHRTTSALRSRDRTSQQDTRSSAMGFSGAGHVDCCDRSRRRRGPNLIRSQKYICENILKDIRHMFCQRRR